MDKHVNIGILAHVDAGKTTLAENFLYKSGAIRKAGRVDHGDSFLDYDGLEKSRGITIFSRSATLVWNNVRMTLLDTPGHADFSAEMERSLSVLDYAILVIDGSDGVAGDVPTLVQLLARYEVPTFFFVNKMDRAGTDSRQVYAELREKLSDHIVDFTGLRVGESTQGGILLGNEASLEAVACTSDALTEEYLETGALPAESVALAIAERSLFPCFFGAALKDEGVDELLDGLATYTLQPQFPEEFGARVYKIERDASGMRLTHLLVTGGVLRVKTLLSGRDRTGEAWEEKADSLRIYQGATYQAVDEVCAGEVCAVTGLSKTYAGEGLGALEETLLPSLEPVLTYQLQLPEGVDPVTVLPKLRSLEEELPELHLVWRPETREIHVCVMGQVQMEVLTHLLQERFGLKVAFDAGSIVYKETLAAPVEGVGHFEPLRHYAEVHLLLEPGEPGSGLQFATACSEDVLDKNWQRLVLTHLKEKVQPGVLTGAEVTDLRIVLLTGRAHAKHTEGGDFRQATYRAVRNGLKKGQSILLEPWYRFRLELPTEHLGRAMTDISRMCGKVDAPNSLGEMSVLTGTCPVATMRDYAGEVAAYSSGRGRLSCAFAGYEPCHNAEEVIQAAAYDAEADIEHPTGSVFCAHGAGFVVPWDQVEDYAHLPMVWRPENSEEKDGREDGAGSGMIGGAAAEAKRAGNAQGQSQTGSRSAERIITQEEIEAIFRQTYGKKAVDEKRFRRYHAGEVGTSVRSNQGGSSPESREATRTWKEAHGMGPATESAQDILLVDGYNIIFAWEELKELAKENLDSARWKLMDVMSNYQGYRGCELILVFDAYRVKGNPGSVMRYHNITVIYTKEAQTADQYIEKTVHELKQSGQSQDVSTKGPYRIQVATSDGLEQLIIWGNGALRMSARELLLAVENAGKRE